jgi:hypothetical protein
MASRAKLPLMPLMPPFPFKKSQKSELCGNIACLLEKTLLCLHTVLLYRLTGKLINYYRKPSKALM